MANGKCSPVEVSVDRLRNAESYPGHSNHSLGPSLDAKEKQETPSTVIPALLGIESKTSSKPLTKRPQPKALHGKTQC